MAGSWLTELTGAKKPIIGMAHLPALPGTPLYDSAGGMRHVRDWVARDLEALQGGGIDAVMFCNENDRPYRLDADAASIAAMADVVASLRGELTVPFGVNVLWDPAGDPGGRRGVRGRFRPRNLYRRLRRRLRRLGAFGGRRLPLPPGDWRRELPPAVQHQRRVRRPDRAAAAG